eukprot:1733847-Rhodomonas_salina.1
MRRDAGEEDEDAEGNGGRRQGIMDGDADGRRAGTWIAPTPSSHHTTPQLHCIRPTDQDRNNGAHTRRWSFFSCWRLRVRSTFTRSSSTRIS